MTDRQARLPDDAKAYARSPDFTSDNLPEKLRSAHATKAGTWGLLHVLEGRVRFETEPPRSSVQEAASSETIVIEPEVRHHVTFIEPGRFFIEFYRRSGN